MDRLGIVLQAASMGGWRYCRRLIESILKERADLKIWIFAGTENRELLKEIQQLQETDPDRLAVKFLMANPTQSRSRVVRRFQRLLRWVRGKNKVSDPTVALLNQCDLVFYAWPFGIELPSLDVPVAFIPHDLNYTHFFGAFIVDHAAYRWQLEIHQKWFKHGHPVVSSQFIADEIRAVFRPAIGEPRVIPLSRLSPIGRLPDNTVAQRLKKLNVSSEYVLCVNNFSCHKNVGQVIGAFSYLGEQFPALKLVFCGYGSEGLRGRAKNSWGLDNCEKDWNVVGLGVCSDEELVALIQRAKLVINASFYEAGNGSGVDAWALGTPVAMSSIPPFMEQIERLGVRAQVFNPRCVYEIRDAMLRILTNPAAASRDAEASQVAVEKYSWAEISREYLAFFDDLTDLAGN